MFRHIGLGEQSTSKKYDLLLHNFNLVRSILKQYSKSQKFYSDSRIITTKK